MPTASLFYGADLAYIHDAGFGEFATRAAPEVVRLLRANGVRRGLVVELGCGAGTVARALTDAGYDVLGVDISPAMIRLARTRAPRGKDGWNVAMPQWKPRPGAS